LQHNERSKYSDQSEIRVLTTGGTLEIPLTIHRTEEGILSTEK
jgi:hypothetical protein